MDLLLQGIGLCTLATFSVKTFRRLSPFLLPTNLNRLKITYNPKGESYALVTGASDGIGKEFARQLAIQQFNVLLHGRNRAKLEQVQQEIQNDSKVPKTIKVEVIEMDLTLPSKDIEACAKKLLQNYKINLLVNNAGISSVSSLKNEKSGDTEKIIQTNLVAPTILSQYFLKEHFIDINSSYGIINIGSIVGDFPPGYLSLYSASKSYIKTLSTSLRQEIAHNIQVTCLQPYYVSTKMTGFQKLSFTTITAEEFTRGGLNVFINQKDSSCGSLRHETIYLAFSILPLSYVLSHLTKYMKVIDDIQKRRNDRRLMKEEKAKRKSE